jgi:hypothetical protein
MDVLVVPVCIDKAVEIAVWLLQAVGLEVSHLNIDARWHIPHAQALPLEGSLNRLTRPRVDLTLRDADSCYYQ